MSESTRAAKGPQLRRTVFETPRTEEYFDVRELQTPEVKAVAKGMTVSCATDGNHGRSVAQGAQLVGAGCAIFVHAGR